LRIHAQHLLRELNRVFALVREQAGVGEIEQGVGVSRLQGDRFLKRLDGLRGFALFVVTLARVHQPDKFIAAGGLSPKPEDKKKREQRGRERDKEISRRAALGAIGTAGLHAGRLAQKAATARQTICWQTGIGLLKP
jgi:hypothetical protein